MVTVGQQALPLQTLQQLALAKLLKPCSRLGLLRRQREQPPRKQGRRLWLRLRRRLIPLPLALLLLRRPALLRMLLLRVLPLRLLGSRQKWGR